MCDSECSPGNVPETDTGLLDLFLSNDKVLPQADIFLDCSVIVLEDPNSFWISVLRVPRLALSLEFLG